MERRSVMTKAIEVKQLKFKYKDSKDLTLENIDLSVSENEILGIVGPNGAGKSTFISILEGLRSDYTGEVHILGFDMKKEAPLAQREMGALFQSSGYLDNLTVKESLELFSQMYTSTISLTEALKQMNAQDLLTRKVKNLSGGQKQKFGIALSLLNQPKLLFLDEPTTGLDPDARLHLWKIIKRLRGKTTTIICSHYLDEVAYLCDRVCFIYDGKVYATDTPEGLIKQSNAPTRIEFDCSDLDAVIKEDSNSLTKNTIHHLTGERYFISAAQPDSTLSTLYTHKALVTNIDIKKPTLNDAYYKITGENMEGVI